MSNSQSINDDFFEAVKKGDINEVNRLIDEGANVNATDWLQMTPLHWAAEKGHKDVVEVLSNRGADVNAVTFTNMVW